MLKEKKLCFSFDILFLGFKVVMLPSEVVIILLLLFGIRDGV